MGKKSQHTADPKDGLDASCDPLLTSLFASSVSTAFTLGPIKTAPKVSAVSTARITDALDSGVLDNPADNDPPPGATADGETEIANAVYASEQAVPALKSDLVPQYPDQRSRKRKRKDTHDNLEGVYLQNLAREELKEHAKRRKQKHNSASEPKQDAEQDVVAGGEGSESDNTEISTAAEAKDLLRNVPQHGSLSHLKTDSDLEKASRTVFLANVSTIAIKSKGERRTLLEHLASFLPSLPKQDTDHKVDSLRFRSTAFTNSAVPKKAAFAKKDLMDSTTKSTNAYAVYTTQLAAREATKRLNGTIVLDRHLRVDSVAHPAKQDHRRCVFVGNLGFVDDQNSMNAAEDDANNKRPRKAREAADIEEGLWREFSKAGTVESVRVVRDKTTRVGKGFAYVQFENPNGVEKALLYNDKKFPPLLPRTLRVTRAKNISKTNARLNSERRPNKSPVQSQKSTGYQPKISSQAQSLEGRAGRLLGRAGAAQFRGNGERQKKPLDDARSSKVLVFEGYRAKSHEGKSSLKVGGTGKKQGKPQNRSSKRGAAFKASGRVKSKG